MELSQIGYFTKTHGVKGHLILKAEKSFFTDELKVLFIDSPSGKAPHFVNELKESNTGLIIGLEDVATVEKARLLLGKAVYVQSSLLDSDDEEFDWIGYTLVDKTFGVLGQVTGVSDNGQQLLLSVEYKGREVLLPLVEDFIEKIEEESRTLFFNAPEGLIELYLETGE